jgi:predicted esterase
MTTATTTALLALHGFSQNGAYLRAALAPLAQRFDPAVVLDYPDAPTACAEASVERMQRMLGGEQRWPPPHRIWFNASDDGREYHGLPAAHALLAERVSRARAAGARVGMLGFSQGAIATACFAALSAHGRFPPLDFVVLIAGRPPRADAIVALLAQPIGIPSLHVWGDRDPFGTAAPRAAADLFAPDLREVVTWPGAHVAPTQGDAADAIVHFVERQAAARERT